MGPPREGEVEVHGYVSVSVCNNVYNSGYHGKPEQARLLFRVRNGTGVEPSERDLRGNRRSAPYQLPRSPNTSMIPHSLSAAAIQCSWVLHRASAGVPSAMAWMIPRCSWTDRTCRPKSPLE